PPPPLHSRPTRRSSDLPGRLPRHRRRGGGQRLGRPGRQLPLHQRDGEPHHRRQLHPQDLRHHRHGRRRRLDQRLGHGRLRGGPELHHHPGRLPRHRRRGGGQRLGRPGRQLPLHQRDGEPHHRRPLHPQDVRPHGHTPRTQL